MTGRFSFCLAFLATLLWTAPATAQKAEGLALTPPMGWNSWNHYGCNIDETLIRRTADAMVSSGLRDAGYVTDDLEYPSYPAIWRALRSG